MLRSLLPFCLFALISPPAGAQDSAASAHAYRPVLGLRVGPPLRAAFNIGLARGHYGRSGFVGTGIILEAGSGGGQLSLARTAGSSFSSARIQISALRTWGEPQSVAPRQTFIGVEARFNGWDRNWLGVLRPSLRNYPRRWPSCCGQSRCWDLSCRVQPNHHIWTPPRGSARGSGDDGVDCSRISGPLHGRVRPRP